MATRYFKLVAGKHSEPTYNNVGRVSGSKAYNARDPKNNIVESETDLVKAFPNKFVEVDKKGNPKREEVAIEEVPENMLANDQGTKDPPNSPQALPLKATDNEAEDEGDDEDERELVDSKLGEDVTDDFPNALKKNLLVFKKGREYFVAAADDPNDQLNPNPLKKDKVEAFVKKQ